MNKQPLYIRDTTGKIISIPYIISNESYGVKQKGTLYTSYFAKLKQGKGTKISIARYNPRWLKSADIDCWYQELAPTRQLLNDYKYNGLNWTDYSLIYKDYISKGYISSLFIRTQIDSIAKLLDNGIDVTLYCYEKPTDNCHRHLLGDMFREIGYEVKEIK